MIDAVLCAFGVYVLTLVLSSYSGPLDIFSRLRSVLPEPLFDLFTCFTCLSFWVGGVFALFAGLSWIEYFASVGIAVIAHEATC